ncbi:MAG: hypothetical protein HC927_06420 [Deltaproteobacteria bacterium]|nr:hypothetical protein [Deltaproteobacteria bacterium]
MNTGILVPIIPKTGFDYSFLDGGQSETVVLARAISTVPFYYGSLWIRVHNIRCTIATSVDIEAYETAPSIYDQQPFVMSSPLLSIDIASTSAPSLQTTGDASPLPPFLLISFTARDTTGVTELFFEISIDLLLRAR